MLILQTSVLNQNTGKFKTCYKEKSQITHKLL